MDARNLRSSAQEPLPWLEAVDDEDGTPAFSARKMLAALMVVLLAGAVVAGTLFWLGRQNSGGSGPPELIRAEPGPYKVKPSDPGGLDVAGESETAFATGAGEEPDAQLDLGAVPEEPIARPRPREEAPPQTLPGNEEKVPADEPAPAPSGGAGSVIQLGFYDNGAQANAAWDALSGRFSAIAGMGKIVVPYQNGFRLRAGAASPAEAQRTCQLLKVAGENCFVVR